LEDSARPAAVGVFFRLASGVGFPDADRVPKWVKLIVALVLLPVCGGAAETLWQVLRTCSGADLVWVPFLGGVAGWLVVFWLLPKPMWIYVFGHELTHAVWAWMFGGDIKKFKVSSQGGHVVISQSNFLVVLAPYFFPLYAVGLILIFSLGNFIWNWHAALPVFYLLLGAAYAFHVTLTVHVLQTKQTDITSQGWIFSAVIIFLFNVGLLVFGIPLLTERMHLLTAGRWWLDYALDEYIRLAYWIKRMV
jgi:hypothetical protein